MYPPTQHTSHTTQAIRIVLQRRTNILRYKERILYAFACIDGSQGDPSQSSRVTKQERIRRTPLSCRSKTEEDR